MIKSKIEQARAYSHGIAVCLVVTIAAKFIAVNYGVPVMLMCLLLGMIFNYMSREEPTKAGVQFTSKTILRLGVVLIGARIVFSDFMGLGVNGIAIVIFATGFVIIGSMFFARLLGLDKEQGLLLGGATSICGASAALAISSVMPNSKSLEQNTLIAVLGVTAMGTIAMITYPVIIGFLGYNDYQAGILIGGAIHDVAQVVGAGYSVSTEAGDTAILIKLMRVFLLIPVLFVFVYIFRNSKKDDGSPKNFPFPMFLVGFFILMVLNSLSLIPNDILKILEYSSKWFLMMSLVAVGMKTSPKALVGVGVRPFILVLLNTALLSALYIFVIYEQFI